MPQKQPISLGVGSYERPDLPMSAQRCVNLYAAPVSAESLSDFSLRGTPGISTFGNLGGGVPRGSIVMGGIYYIVHANTLYSVDDVGVGTSLGTVTGSARVSMAHNGDKLCIVVPGGLAYVYVASTTTFSQITDGDFLTSDSVVFKDGYYIFSKTSSNIFFNSALNDPLTFDPLDFGTAEQSPGDITALHANYDEIIVFKQDNAEVFQNVGGSGFPFQRINGASFEKGCHSKYSPIQWEDSVYFLGGGPNERTAFYQARSGANPYIISTDAITNEIQNFTRAEIAESFSFTYSLDGFSFVGFTIRSVNITSRTFVYNVTASQIMKRPVWHEQQTGISKAAWRIESVDFAYDKLIVSDEIDGRLGILSDSVYTEYSDVIRREKSTPPLFADGNEFFMSSLEAILNPGQGLINGQGSEPQIMMDFSDDGGFTWSNEFWRPMGKIGAYQRRAIWRRLGRVPSYRVFRFAISDPIQVDLFQLSASFR